MKMNLKELQRAFRKVTEGETVPRDGLNAYLLEQVLRPTMLGRPPRLNEIDYEQFEEDDIGRLAEYYDHLESTSRQLSQFVGAVASIAATPCRARQFC